MTKIDVERSPLLTSAEAAAFLRISERHVGNLVRGGVLTPTRLGRAVRFTAREVSRVASERS